MKKFLLDRFQEPSTWRGIIWCLAAFGVYTLNTEQSQAVTALAMALAGAQGVITPDRFGTGAGKRK